MRVESVEPHARRMQRGGAYSYEHVVIARGQLLDLPESRRSGQPYALWMIAFTGVCDVRMMR
jgi:hypothetical protein